MTTSSCGGMFGAALARNMFFRSERLRDNDASDLRNYRILVLEAGPYSPRVRPEPAPRWFARRSPASGRLGPRIVIPN